MQKIEQLLNKIEQENFQNDVDWLTGTQSWQELKDEVKLLLQQHDVTGSAVSEALPELLKVAASLVRNGPSSFDEDWKFSKSTPKKDRRKVLYSSAAVNESSRLAAIKLKSIYDILVRHCL
jgi:hypothetical protein